MWRLYPEEYAWFRCVSLQRWSKFLGSLSCYPLGSCCQILFQMLLTIYPLISRPMNQSPSLLRILFHKTLVVVMSSVRVVTSPGYLIRFPPAVSFLFGVWNLLPGGHMWRLYPEEYAWFRCVSFQRWSKLLGYLSCYPLGPWCQIIFQMLLTIYHV